MRQAAIGGLLVVLTACGAPPAGQPPAAGGAQGTGTTRQLQRPEELGRLEDPDREEWQQPDRVMDLLQIADGSHVADIGAGGGWFTMRLARRVGPNGMVYAEDIQPEMLSSIEKRVNLEGLKNVRTVLGTPTDSHLTPPVQAILLVGAYSQLSHPVELLRNAASALAPNGRIGVIDFKKDGAGGPGPPLDQRIAPDAVIAQAREAGLKVQSQETFLRYQYLLVFVK